MSRVGSRACGHPMGLSVFFQRSCDLLSGPWHFLFFVVINSSHVHKMLWYGCIQRVENSKINMFSMMHIQLTPVN